MSLSDRLVKEIQSVSFSYWRGYFTVNIYVSLWSFDENDTIFCSAYFALFWLSNFYSKFQAKDIVSKIWFPPFGDCGHWPALWKAWDEYMRICTKSLSIANTHILDPNPNPQSQFFVTQWFLRTSGTTSAWILSFDFAWMISWPGCWSGRG